MQAKYMFVTSCHKISPRGTTIVQTRALPRIESGDNPAVPASMKAYKSGFGPPDMSDFAVHPTASIIGEAGSILSRTRAALAPAKPVLGILDRIDPLAKLAAMR